MVVFGESEDQLEGLFFVEFQVLQPAILPCCDHVVIIHGPVGRIDQRPCYAVEQREGLPLFIVLDVHLDAVIQRLALDLAVERARALQLRARPLHLVRLRLPRYCDVREDPTRCCCIVGHL